MLCCRPKKDKYNFDEAETNNESEKKKVKSKDSKKSKNQDKVDKTNMGNAQGTKKDNGEKAVLERKEDENNVENNVESDANPKNVTAVVDLESNKEQTVEGHNDTLDDVKAHEKNKLIPGGTDDKTVEETITKSNAEVEESAISAIGGLDKNSDSNKVLDKAETGTESCRDENIVTRIETEVLIAWG